MSLVAGWVLWSLPFLRFSLSHFWWEGGLLTQQCLSHTTREQGRRLWACWYTLYPENKRNIERKLGKKGSLGSFLTGDSQAVLILPLSSSLWSVSPHAFMVHIYPRFRGQEGIWGSRANQPCWLKEKKILTWKGTVSMTKDTGMWLGTWEGVKKGWRDWGRSKNTQGPREGNLREGGKILLYPTHPNAKHTYHWP